MFVCVHMSVGIHNCACVCVCVVTCVCTCLYVFAFVCVCVFMCVCVCVCLHSTQRAVVINQPSFSLIKKRSITGERDRL